MPVDDETLKLIRAENRRFGTIRFERGASRGWYRDHLEFAQGQLPSIYVGAQGEPWTCRIRPIHEHGFCVTRREKRLYFAVAGLPYSNPYSALSSEYENVNGPIQKSKYYVFVRLGVSGSEISQTITALIKSSQELTTRQLQYLNLESEAASDNISVAFVSKGQMAGTFWAYRRDGWGKYNGSSDPCKNRFMPLQLLDFPLRDQDLGNATATGQNFSKCLQLIPKDIHRVHNGHALITPEALENYYTNQAMTVDHIDGKTIWNKLMYLSSADQKFDRGVRMNGGDLPALPLVSGNEYFPLAADLNVDQQRRLIYAMIDFFRL